MVLVKTQEFVKPFQLQTGMRQVGRVSVGKVGENPFHFDIGTQQRSLLDCMSAVIMDPDPFHPGVNLQVDFRLHAHLTGDRLNLFQAFHRRSRQG